MINKHRSSNLLNKFSISVPLEMYREQYEEYVSRSQVVKSLSMGHMYFSKTSYCSVKT